MNRPTGQAVELAAENFLTEDERQRVQQAIVAAERVTSGEIRVHLDDHAEGDLLDRAAFVFTQLGIDRTKDRNGVLFYVSAVDHRAAVLGDAGIHARVGQDFWHDVLAIVLGRFKEGRFADGLIEGIARAGEKLREHFPYQQDDRDELSNEISVER